MKRGNFYPILIVKIIEWREFIDYFGRSIEVDPSRVSKKNVIFFHIGYTPITSSGQLHISSHQLDKELNSEPPKLGLRQQKSLAAEIAPQVYYTLRDLCLFFL